MPRQKAICWHMPPDCNMKIYTITLNPAYDVHAYAQQFVPFHENLAHIRSREAGGKGLNISRALTAAGVKNRAVIVLGTENDGDYKKHLTDTGIDCLLLEREGRIRENLTLHCPDAPETRISFAGFPVDRSVLLQIEALLEVDADTVITFTGRVADGVSMADVKAFLGRLREKGAKIVLDSRSFGLQDLYDVKPWLIKPNQEEISTFFGSPVETVAQAAQRARELAAHGIPNVMISLGHQGALLASGGVVLHAMPPETEPVSTVGAGDSTIAGFITAAARRETPEECLRLGVSFGTAACLTEGTQPPQSQKVREILEKVTVKEVS